jgi:hypothetical protein
MSNGITNDFQMFMHYAKTKRWCIEFVCTTCGSMEFRNALLKELQNDAVGFIESMKKIDLKHLREYRSITISFYHIYNILYCPILYNIKLAQRNLLYELLNYWVEKDDIPIRFVDYFMFYIVKNINNNSIKGKYILKSIELIEKEMDISLTETLLLIYRENSKENVRLMNVAIELGENSKLIRNLLFKFSLM